MTMECPRLTVLMPVYNGQEYLRPALESILSQTFRDFEFLILNDGSTDDSVGIIESYQDPRIRLVHNSGNVGLVATLNRGLELARGPYIARMDCDDISHPTRLARQALYLSTHPAVGVVGSWMEFFGDLPARTMRYPVRPARVRVELLFRCSLAHPSVMFRRESFRHHHLQYDPGFPHAEDWALWSACSHLFPIANIPEVLLRYRVHPDRVCVKWREIQRRSEDLICIRSLGELGVRATEEELSLHRQMDWNECPLDRCWFERAFSWLAHLHDANQRLRRYPEPAFTEALGQVWYRACLKSRESVAGRWRRFLTSPWARTGVLGALRERYAAVNLAMHLPRVRFRADSGMALADRSG